MIMSLLNLRKTKKTEKAPATKKLVATEASKPAVALKHVEATSVRLDVLLRPHISERASDSAAKGVYVFKVTARSTKPQIKAAVAALYKVTVTKVSIVSIHPKRITVKGKPGIRIGSKKAYVYLKEGEKIEIV